LCLVAATPVAVAFLLWSLSDELSTPVSAVGAAEVQPKQPADNGPCYVCHADLQAEKITEVHASKGHGCTECHGPSGEHMQDEMQMTTPDKLFGRSEVAGMCRECHEDPHEKKREKVKSFLEEWRGRARPNGRTVSEKSICTDCHGTHNISREPASRSQHQPAEWVPAFNGKDLAGWRATGSADWKVKLGRIVGTGGPEGGDLWTEAEYENYLMAVTFRTDWPIHAGIWLRGSDGRRGPRVEIFQSTRPLAQTGSVGLPGKGLALANLREDLFDPEGWNTLSVEVRGNRVAVWLNGEEVGAVRSELPAKGRIGLHLRGGPSFKDAQLAVREVLVQRLPKEEAKKQ
jgi:hypothetical protein